MIEVGPGLGAMTGRLAESAGQVLAVEIDRSLIPPLQAVCMEHGNIELIEGDILKLDIRSIAAERIAASGGALKRVKVVANLPYYITTPIILSFLEHALPLLTSMTFMVQKEVAQRMTARPGGKEYGALTVAVGYFSEPELLFTVPPHCFLPQPRWILRSFGLWYARSRRFRWRIGTSFSRWCARRSVRDGKCWPIRWQTLHIWGFREKKRPRVLKRWEESRESGEKCCRPKSLADCRI